MLETGVRRVIRVFVFAFDVVVTGLRESFFARMIAGSIDEHNRVAKNLLWSRDGDECAHCDRLERVDAFVRRQMAKRSADQAGQAQAESGGDVTVVGG